MRADVLFYQMIEVDCVILCLFDSEKVKHRECGDHIESDRAEPSAIFITAYSRTRG